MQLPSPLKLGDIIKSCSAMAPADIPGGFFDLEIHSLDSPPFSTQTSLSFLKNKSHISKSGFKAAAIVAENIIPGWEDKTIRVKNIYEVIHKLLSSLFSPIKNPGRDRPRANPNFPQAKVFGNLGNNVSIGPGCYVGPDCMLKDNVVLEPNVTVLAGVEIGESTYLQSGCVIGSAGFGFYEKGGKNIPMPHLAGVKIGRQCWIGANSVVAAGVLNPTYIGEFSRLDSHLQIAHNVYLGSHATIASQSGIAGSTIIGPHFTMGGASSVTGHIHIGERVTVAARSGVTKPIKQNETVAGFPAQPIKSWKRQQIILRKLEKDFSGFPGKQN